GRVPGHGPFGHGLCRHRLGRLAPDRAGGRRRRARREPHLLLRPSADEEAVTADQDAAAGRAGAQRSRRRTGKEAPPPALEKIISGGQTGVDQGALCAARKAGFPTGGWAPKGWLTERGPAPWLAELGLLQHASPSYPLRTRANVAASDATLC